MKAAAIPRAGRDRSAAARWASSLMVVGRDRRDRRLLRCRTAPTNPLQQHDAIVLALIGLAVDRRRRRALPALLARRRSCASGWPGSSTSSRPRPTGSSKRSAPAPTRPPAPTNRRPSQAADFSRMWTPQAEPRPMTWARPTLAPSIWRSPASPRRWWQTSQMLAMPVAAIGWPFDSQAARHVDRRRAVAPRWRRTRRSRPRRPPRTA